jgi:phage repressor protein C with HTH and peptisase S24 domain
VVDGNIYVLSIDGLFKVKRLRRIKDGLLIVSDNPEYPPESYTGEECDRVKVFGRVLHVSRTF